MNVLLIDNVEADLTQLRTLLTLIYPRDLTITDARTENEARSELDQLTYQVILLNLSLTRGHSLELIHHIAKTKTETAIITLNGVENESEVLAAVRAGAQDYISKRQLSEPILRRAIRYALERKQSEAKMRLLNQQLEKSLVELQDVKTETIRRERLSAIGNMSAGIAHDFNNALSPILANTDFLLDYPETLQRTEECMNLLRSTKEAARKASSIVRRLKAFYKPSHETNRFQTVNISDIIKEVIELAKPEWKDHSQVAGKQIQVIFEPNAGASLEGNPSELKDALLNILMNSIAAIERQGEIRFDLKKSGHFIELTITDDGAGMDEVTKQNCFEPFVTTKGKDGTGLGLSATYGIVQRHHGTICVASTPGKGTRFTLRFDLSAKNDTAAPTGNAHHKKSPTRILLVDDEANIRQIAQMVLQREGHQCVTAVDGEDALRQMKEHEFDLVITDRAMPGMNGDELAVAIQEFAPQLPIIMLTGYGDLMAATEERPKNVTQVVPKPFTTQTLRNIIAAHQGSAGS